MQVGGEHQVVGRFPWRRPGRGVVDDPVHREAQSLGHCLAFGDPHRAEVHRGHLPPPRGQPDRMAPLSRSEVQRRARRPCGNDALDLRVRCCAPDPLSGGVPVVPHLSAFRHAPSIPDMTSQTSDGSVRIRDAAPADVPAMAAIYDEQVLTSVATFETELRGSVVPEREARHRRRRQPRAGRLRWGARARLRVLGTLPAAAGVCRHPGGVRVPRLRGAGSRPRTSPVCRAARPSRRPSGDAHAGGGRGPAQRRERGPAHEPWGSRGSACCGKWDTSSAVMWIRPGTNGCRRAARSSARRCGLAQSSVTLDDGFGG